jgi:hypothetical protein
MNNKEGEMHLLFFKFLDINTIIDQIYKKYKLKYRVKNRNGFRDVFMIRMPYGTICSLLNMVNCLNFYVKII